MGGLSVWFESRNGIRFYRAKKEKPFQLDDGIPRRNFPFLWYGPLLMNHSKVKERKKNLKFSTWCSTPSNVAGRSQILHVFEKTSGKSLGPAPTTWDRHPAVQAWRSWAEMKKSTLLLRSFHDFGKTKAVGSHAGSKERGLRLISYIKK